MELQKLLRASYLDILFDGRNKKYGGYELRINYEVRARRAMAIVLTSAILCGAIPLIAAHIKPDGGRTRLTNETIVTLVAPPVDPIKPPIVTPPAPPPASTEIIANTVPLVVIDKDVHEPPKTKEELEGAQVGLQTIIGPPDGLQPDLTGNGGKGREQVELPGEASPGPVRVVDQYPSFNGDLSKYLNDHLIYPEEARSRGETGRVGIEFVVNEDGSISDAVVTNSAGTVLNAEALRVVSGMPKWKPGKLNGKAVKTYFKIPIVFQMD